VPPIFAIIQREGQASAQEMYQVFNMGLGMVAVCQEENIASIQAAVPDARVVGRIVSRQGEEQVLLSDA
jgi:phosphoribosylformylglycinamidine cyclo-ligase